jgi:hypothetical protein
MWSARLGVAAVAIIVGLAACGGPPRQLIYQRTVPLPGGRFVGPIEIELPRRADHGDRDLEIEAELHAACDPLLRVSFPDGELSSVGAADDGWQELLSRRAAHPEEAAGAGEAAPAPEVPAKGAGPGAVPPSPAAQGRWQAVRTESWPGQLAFLEQRAARCTSRRRFTRRYLTAFDQTGRLTVWAETPQEVADGALHIKVFAVGEVAPPPEAPPRARVQATARAATRPRPPRPAPRAESPPPARAAGARWVAGEWVYSPGEGKWVWRGGHWAPPATTPARRVERPGGPPVAGCTWSSGYWVWQQGPGAWRWVDGHWLAPPPLDEQPGEPPVPESPWVPGRWIAVQASFQWQPGHWGRPTPRAETPPEPPYAGARWVAGTWLRLDGRWTWSPGFYERSDRPPPRPRAETPPAKPAPGAVWLAGFWRWNDVRRDHEWVAGHWELPPGDGYVWVADPPPPGGGPSISGRWVLEIDLTPARRPGRR